MGEVVRQLLLGMSDGGAGSLLFIVETPLIMVSLALIAETQRKQNDARLPELVPLADVDPFAVQEWTTWE